MRKIALLGSTGSIGKSTLKIVSLNREKFSIESISAGKNIELLIEQIKEFSPKTVCVSDKNDIDILKEIFPKINFYSGKEGLIEVVSTESVNTLIPAITGTVPLEATIESIKMGHRICLANKETLVAAGTLINNELKLSKSEIIPIDSEQSAIFQSLGNNTALDLNKVILTASGGPFYKRKLDEFHDITIQDALNHPTWNMGTKITIDSATLMNKALEIIEAYYLFNLKPSQIDVIIHPQSIIHSMVEFVDSSVIAQMSLPDMQIPILYSLAYPERISFKNNQLNFNELKKLDFFPVDKEKFSSIRMAYEVLESGKNSGAIFNAANEVAVDYFLKKKISFVDIFKTVEKVLSESELYEIDSVASVLNTVKTTKKKTEEIILEK